MTERSGLDSYLGAARAVRVEQRSIVVALVEAAGDDTPVVHATLALAFPYRPVVGDELLVVGDARAFYVIGVLRGRGHTTLSNPRGVSIRAEAGALRLVGDRAVRLTGSRVRLEAERVRRLAVEFMQTLGEQETRVRDGVSIDAGEVDEASKGRWILQAQRVVVKALRGARVKSTNVRIG